MIRKPFLFLGVAVLALACESSADLTAKVKSELSNDRSITNASHIDVSAQRGVVTLSGTAESSFAKERAVDVAQKTEGVSDVIDKLTVVEPQAAVAPNTSASAGPPGVAPDDATITSTIRSKLQTDQRVAGAKIDVETQLGVVTLSGTVKSESIKRDAMQIAQDTPGVEKVEDQLTVKAS
jgi:hyperosmotically inducible protein